MSARLIESLATTDALAAIFSDESIVQAMLAFEVALARAEAGLGIIPQAAAAAIASAAQLGSFDYEELSRQTLRAGTPGIPIVKALTEGVRAVDRAAAGYVHWGATSQDVADTALMLLLKQAHAPLAADHARLDAALLRLSNEHANTVMLGRTLLQPAPPVTFGLKAAGWLAATRRGWKRVDQRFREGLALQFGGASGTLASLGDQGIAIGRAIASDLGLQFPDAPWHAHRDSLAAFLAACSVQTGSLGKMARDIELLMQDEVSEAAEPGGDGRGGSSTMPHKRNPIACSIAVAASYRTPGLLASFLSAMVQEHERAAGGWQAEWPIVAGIVQAVGVAAASMAEAAEGLRVDVARTRVNIDATRGAVFAERVSMLLAPKIGRDAAHKLVEQAARQSAAEQRGLLEVLAGMPGITKHLSRETLAEIDNPEQYLGAAEAFRKRLTGSE